MSAKGLQLLNDFWPELLSQAERMGKEEGYSPLLATKLARITRGRLERLGLPEIFDWQDVGVDVKRRNLSSSGMLVRRSPHLEVWVDKSDDRRRQRFTVGHEVGHYLLPARTKIAPRLLEGMCDTFAAELLLPVNRVRSRLTASGGIESPLDILDLANHANINISPVVTQVAGIAWDPALLVMLATPQSGSLRIRSGAGPRVGAPFENQRVSSLGRWRVLYAEVDGLIRRKGIVHLAYRFLRPQVPNSEASISGLLRGVARWSSIELRNGRSIFVLNFLEPPETKLSQRAAAAAP